MACETFGIISENATPVDIKSLQDLLDSLNELFSKESK